MTRNRHLKIAPSPQSVGDWARETVQRHADDVVLAAGLFKPNAAGSFDFSPAGFADRQLMKSRGAYLGERVLLGATPLHVCVVEVFGNGHFQRKIACWLRDDLVVEMVAAKRGRREPADPSWPAFLLTKHTGRPLAEVQVVERNPESERLVELLRSGRSIVDGRAASGQ